MDISFNRTEFNQRVGTLSRTKRVRKSNQDEPEQNQKKFAEHFAQATNEDSEESAGNNQEQRGKTISAKGVKPQSDHPGSPDEGAPGQVIDITI